MGIDDIRQQIARLSVSCNALVAMGIVLQARAAGMPADPAVQRQADEVLKALGVCEAVHGLAAADIAPVLAGIRADLLIGAKMIAGPPSHPGWTHGESALLQSAGDVSAGFPPLLKTRIAPQLDGLSDRLAAPGAAFLDVGVGVAALSIAMVRQWPSLRVVGIDPWAPSLTIARRNVLSAGLAPRIELREIAGEDLAEFGAYDLAWIPSLFIPQRSIARIMQRAGQALRPGGWLLFPTLNPGDDPLVAATARFRTALWGGSSLSPDAATTLLREAGLIDVRLLPGAAASAIGIAVGRCPKV
jgi:2-polyprenyl-3-methyl-5-hydroxy-6-metoxy-1,4-benzoquinol methylase